MRKYLTSTDYPFTLLIIMSLFISACTVTPTQESTVAAEQPAEPVEPVEAVEATAVTQVTEVDVQTEELPTPPAENDAELLASAPEQYIVQKGDTLWGISSKFLQNPWYWPEIWYMNPQVQNPHLIYPGDVINVFYVGGRPYLTVERPYLNQGDSGVSGVERLSPQVRSEAIEVTEKIIPIQAIEQFLIRPQIVDEYTLESAPHIVGSKDNRIIYGANDSVYVRDSEGFEVGDAYSVYRKGEEFIDPVSGELLGYQATHIADGEVTEGGNPATVYISKAEREVMRGDRLISLEVSDSDSAFRPQPPSSAISGEVIYLFDAITQVGTYQIVVTNLGDRNGIEKGNVVNINHAGRVVEDRFADRNQEKEVKLPDAPAADAIIFRTFDKLSYAFILDAQRPIKVGDIVTNPE